MDMYITMMLNTSLCIEQYSNIKTIAFNSTEIAVNRNNYNRHDSSIRQNNDQLQLILKLRATTCNSANMNEEWIQDMQNQDSSTIDVSRANNMRGYNTSTLISLLRQVHTVN